jgi:uncharacterized membrane protein
MPDGTTHGFVYANVRMTDLNFLLAPGTTTLVKSAAGINDQGQICATSISTSYHALLLTPNH